MFFRRLRRIGRAVEHAQRYRVIVGVFLKYGYGDLAQRLPLPAPVHLPFRKTREAQEEIALMTAPERLRRAFEELGPAFVKFGQLLSTRSLLLPQAFIIELSKLHDEVPPVPFDQVLAVLASELKRPPGECFESIDETPIGSASIAQVHRAVRVNGEKCVIKVQRPGIEKIVRADLEIMAQLAGLLERHVEGWQVHKPTDIVAEFARRMEQEMDFRAEAAHIERFAEQFAKEPTIYVPKAFLDTSTLRVLTMERIDAVKASNFDELDVVGLDRIVIATRIADLVMKQIFVHGFFHADPHPGNIHILPGNVICFLDFGMMGFLDQRTRETFSKFVMGIAQRNEVSTAAALLRLTHADLEPPRQGFEADVAEFMHRNFYRPLGEMVFGQLVNQLFTLTTRYRLTLPPDLSTMLKALALMENLVTRLDPGHDILAQAKPFMRQARLQQLQPRRLLRHWMEFNADVGDLLRDLPLEARRLIAIIKEGRGRLMVHHQGLEGLINTLERIVNRLAFSLVLSALIIASSIIVHARVPPIWHDMSVLGVLGYLLAGIMGFWLLIAMIRHGKM
ncbi:MAG TPA: AarF/ABC1/UbiB kinase family protein [Candidatus Saccharimonadales bacterium]|nr:AarF/ABC1/UbiB kinase family protein [Candidatus Saccharimonadales bacterium]